MIPPNLLLPPPSHVVGSGSVPELALELALVVGSGSVPELARRTAKRKERILTHIPITRSNSAQELRDRGLSPIPPPKSTLTTASLAERGVSATIPHLGWAFVDRGWR